MYQEGRCRPPWEHQNEFMKAQDGHCFSSQLCYHHSQGRDNPPLLLQTLSYSAHAQKVSGGEPSTRCKEKEHTWWGCVHQRCSTHSQAKWGGSRNTQIAKVQAYFSLMEEQNRTEGTTSTSHLQNCLASLKSTATFELSLTTAINFHVGKATLLFPSSLKLHWLHCCDWHFKSLYICLRHIMQHRKISIQTAEAQQRNKQLKKGSSEGNNRQF